MAFQQGLSGLSAASKSLDVIGHNIANSNTTGFKASRAEFSEMIATAVGSAGGNDAGIGVTLDTVAQQFTQGNISITGNTLDVAINGNGFFQVRQPDGSMAYTRAGNFKLDDQGNMITNGAAQLMGYPVDPLTGERSSISVIPLVFPTGAPIPARQTGEVTVAMNLDARATDAAGDPAATPPVSATPRTTYGTSLNVYDSQGVAVPVSLYFQKTGTANTWDVYDRLDDPTASPPVVATPVGQLVFNGAGVLQSGSPLTLTVDPSKTNPNNPPAAFAVTLDLSAATQFGTKFAVSDLTQDGYTAGQLTGITIGSDGTLMTQYSNGVSRPEGQIALASFRNAQGLEDVGNNLWVETSSSGQPVLGAPLDGNFGTLRAGALEDSNVDLTAELVNMMTAQRAYQANAQTIKTQDQVLATLVNLR
ncbi:MAG: flagellar hook protein FlgE [Comamonadaceae bacterium]|nr:flagellar hook protein FlgE [Burkholderiales bacterium]MEB2348513.1 flagellar hook protein FlgE [Comamonadaceae bacterium]